MRGMIDLDGGQRKRKRGSKLSSDARVAEGKKKDPLQGGGTAAETMQQLSDRELAYSTAGRNKWKIKHKRGKFSKGKEKSGPSAPKGVPGTYGKKVKPNKGMASNRG